MIGIIGQIDPSSSDRIKDALGFETWDVVSVLATEIRK